MGKRRPLSSGCLGSDSLSAVLSLCSTGRQLHRLAPQFLHLCQGVEAVSPRLIRELRWQWLSTQHGAQHVGHNPQRDGTLTNAA